MGNICRSPTAEAVFRKMVTDAGIGSEVAVDSAGTHGYHVGEAPDVRSQLAGRKRGYDLSAHRARQITLDDYSGDGLGESLRASAPVPPGIPP